MLPLKHVKDNITLAAARISLRTENQRGRFRSYAKGMSSSGDSFNLQFSSNLFKQRKMITLVHKP